MAKIVCVLYPDPVDGYPTSYAREGLPGLERYPDGQTLPRLRQLTSHPVSCWVACPANLVYVGIWKTSVTS